jgi:hypothetical protein
MWWVCRVLPTFLIRITLREIVPSGRIFPLFSPCLTQYRTTFTVAARMRISQRERSVLGRDSVRFQFRHLLSSGWCDHVVFTTSSLVPVTGWTCLSFNGERYVSLMCKRRPPPCAEGNVRTGCRGRGETTGRRQDVTLACARACLVSLR